MTKYDDTLRAAIEECQSYASDNPTDPASTALGLILPIVSLLSIRQEWTLLGKLCMSAMGVMSKSTFGRDDKTKADHASLGHFYMGCAAGAYLQAKTEEPSSPRWGLMADVLARLFDCSRDSSKLVAINEFILNLPPKAES